MTETASQPESDPVRSHVEMLHSLAAGIDGVLVVSAFNASLPSDKGVITHHRPGDVDGMVDAIAAHANTPRMNVYAGLQVMRRGLARGHRGGEKDIVSVLGLVADMDADTGKATGAYPIDPNYVLETSPGNFQPFWLFDRPISAVVAKGIAHGLKVATGSDHGTADIAHVWRVPGTLNWPSEKKLARGRCETPAHVTVAQPWDGTLTDPAALALAVAGSHQSTRAAAPAATIGVLPDVDGVDVSTEAAALLSACDVGDRSAHAARVVEKLAFDGHPVEVAAAHFVGATGDWFGRYASVDAARKDFARIWSKFGAGHDDARGASIGLGAKLLQKAKPAAEAANDNSEDWEPDDAELPAPAAAGLASELCFPPGAVGDISQFIMSCARFPSPHLSLVSAIALVAGMVGRRYKGPTGVRSNIYIVGLAESGFGKDITIRAAEAIADSTPAGGKVSEAIFADKIRSLPGLANRLKKSPSCIAVIDEFGKFLSLHTGRAVAPHREEITTALMELTGAPQGSWGGQEKAGGNIPRIVQPCLTVHGISTPTTFWGALSSGNITEGLLGRLVVIDAGDEEPRKVRAPSGSIDSIPDEIAEHVTSLLGGGGVYGGGAFYALNAKSDEKPWPLITAEFAPGVDDLFEDFDDRIRGMRAALDPQFRPILNRVGENAARLALIVAVGVNPKEPVISSEIQAWANAVAESSFYTIVRGAKNHIADNDRSAEYLRVRNMIARAGADGLTRGVVERRLRGAIDKRRMDDIFLTLQAAGEIKHGRIVLDSGQARLRYWAASSIPDGMEPITVGAPA